MFIYAAVLISATLAAPAPRAVVTQLDGTRAEGSLVALTAQSLVLQTAKGEQTIDRQTLLSIRFGVGPQVAPAELSVRLELIDGSVLMGDRFQASESQPVTLGRGSDSLKLAARQIVAVRYLGEGEPLDAQWNEIRALRPAADLLVIRKGEALDYVEGRVLEVTDQVKFELDGDPLNVRLNKVAGIIYLRPETTLAETIGVVRDRHGASFNARELLWGDGQLEIVTAAGVETALTADQIHEIDLAAGKIRYLSDLEPLTVGYQPFFPLADASLISPFFNLRRDVAREGGEILLGGKSFAKGLALRSHTKVEYRLPQGYSRFKATVGIDDRIGNGGSVVLTIRGDGNELFSEGIVGGEPPRQLDLNVTRAKQLSIEVDYGGDSDLGDHLDLGDARITK